MFSSWTSANCMAGISRTVSLITETFFCTLYTPFRPTYISPLMPIVCRCVREEKDPVPICIMAKLNLVFARPQLNYNVLTPATTQQLSEGFFLPRGGGGGFLSPSCSLFASLIREEDQTKERIPNVSNFKEFFYQAYLQ